MSDQFILLGDCRELCRDMPENTVDALCTDAPYGLEFMNSKWDKEVPGPDYWTEFLRVLKPGGHLLSMGGTRTFHRLVCAIEDSGFEIRDTLMWLYGSGFPKSHNVALGIDKLMGHENRGRAIPTASTYQACDEKRLRELEKILLEIKEPKTIEEYNIGVAAAHEYGLLEAKRLASNPVEEYTSRSPESEPWQGYGTALKPAYEPIVLARKPFKGSVAKNVLTHGVGGLNIDGCRVGEPISHKPGGLHRGSGDTVGSFKGVDRSDNTPKGRWPANIIHDGSDEVLALFPQSNGKPNPAYSFDGPPSDNVNVGGGQINCQYDDKGSAARFFYCSKASKAEREAGLNDPGKTVLDGRSKPIDNPYLRGETKRKNTHPTVKPIKLGRYLMRLICPQGGVVLDPFVGSGSFGCAAALEDFDFIGLEREKEFVEIAEKRIAYWRTQRWKV